MCGRARVGVRVGVCVCVCVCVFTVLPYFGTKSFIHYNVAFTSFCGVVTLLLRTL